MFKVYKEVWKFMKESRNYYLFIAVLFLASILLGLFFPVLFINFIRNFIEEIVNKIVGLNFIQLFFFILENNVITAFIGVIFGFFLGIAPLFLTFFNGYVIGFIMNKTLQVESPGVLLRLLPHGIFELPALIISLGLGLRLGMFILAKNKKKDFFYALENSLRVFLFIIIPLLLIAAFIETSLIFLIG